MESEFFDKNGAEKVDSFIYFCFVSHGEKEFVIAMCMYGYTDVCLCVRLPVRERKMGGIWEWRRSWVGGWPGKKSRGLLKKWRSWIFDQRYARDAANGWSVVGLVGLYNTRLPFLCLINVKGKTIKCTSSFLLFPFFLIIFFCDTFITRNAISILRIFLN